MRLRIEFYDADTYIEWPAIRPKELIICLTSRSEVVSVTGKGNGPAQVEFTLCSTKKGCKGAGESSGGDDHTADKGVSKGEHVRH